ncbi:Hypothetical protein CINCED_3A009758 [Cinara cedri]|uniref:Uncharacterized protein n=1 Tax=Cinara cedri TaxID=506608 RepID=A0A5E4LZY1_9HEMI|nr:Hypothetical protein CINCED_3A009758 [Cinara cedri]
MKSNFNDSLLGNRVTNSYSLKRKYKDNSFSKLQGQQRNRCKSCNLKKQLGKMFRIEFTLRTSVIQRYTMVLPGALLGRIDHINNALLLSGLGFIMDMFFLLFHKSDSSWLYIKAIQFILRLIICLFQLACITAIYCYVKQEQTIRDNKNNLNWIEKQLNKIVPNSGQSEVPSTSKDPLNEPSTSKLPSSPLNAEPIEDETTAAALVDTPMQPLKNEITDKLPPNINEIPVGEADKITDTDNRSPGQTPGTDGQPDVNSNVNQERDKS